MRRPPPVCSSRLFQQNRHFSEVMALTQAKAAPCRNTSIPRWHGHRNAPRARPLQERRHSEPGAQVQIQFNGIGALPKYFSFTRGADDISDLDDGSLFTLILVCSPELASPQRVSQTRTVAVYPLQAGRQHGRTMHTISGSGGAPNATVRRNHRIQINISIFTSPPREVR
jgi:hypothetical protein